MLVNVVDVVNVAGVASVCFWMVFRVLLREGWWGWC